MTIVLPALEVAFAAFCIWLTVRIVNRRERWAKWTLAVVVSLPVLYVLSFGPVAWIYKSEENIPEWLLNAYQPLKLLEFAPEWILDALRWYYSPWE